MVRNKEETKKTSSKPYTISYYSFHQKEKTNRNQSTSKARSYTIGKPQQANSYTPTIINMNNHSNKTRLFPQRTIL